MAKIAHIFLSSGGIWQTRRILDPYIAKGRQVLIEGHIEPSNMGRFNIVADRVVLGSAPHPRLRTALRAAMPSWIYAIPSSCQGIICKLS